MSTVEQYGRFDEQEGCFVLHSEPPRKWWNLHCNVIGHDEIYAEVSNINDGITRVRDKNGITVNLCGYDSKYHYIRDDESGTAFCATGNPLPTAVTNKSCRYYREKTVMKASCEGLNATQRVFVPQKLPIECTTLWVENTTDKPRNISIFSYTSFALHGCDAEGKWVDSEKYAEVLPEIGGVFCINRNTKTPTNRFKAYLVCLENFFNGNSYRDQFTRAEYALGSPRLIEGWDCDGRPGYGPDCAGSVQVKLIIPPHSIGRADFLLGQAASTTEVAEIRAFLSPEKLDALCDEAGQVEAARASAYTIDVGSKHLNGLFNIFIKKQHYNYLINKSGFRDNLQTDVPLAMSDYPAAEDNLLRALASQHPSGRVPHGFRPLNRLQYSDKPAWILHTVPNLVKESGDFNLLERAVPYLESSECGSVWDHCLRAMRFLAGDLGKHGLCNQHHADWNDGLEATVEAGERESVFVTQQLCYGLLEIAEIARRIGDSGAEQEANFLYKKFSDHINEVAWDGEWYLRTLCADGYKIGSKSNKEGRIFLNTQSWAILSGIAPPDRAALCMSKVDELLESDLGYPLCHPPFSCYDPRVGRMSNSMPGSNENGGCYNHAAGFKGVADCVMGRAEEAWRTFIKVTPDSPYNPLARSGAEPFSYVNSYSMIPYNYGQSGYAWRTGTSVWMATLLIEYILGARRDYDGLRIDPCLPAALPEIRMMRTFRGTRFDISIRRGPPSIIVDGKVLNGRVIPVTGAARQTVEVSLQGGHLPKLVAQTPELQNV
jgi:cellobiose phosphorylase